MLVLNFLLLSEFLEIDDRNRSGRSLRLRRSRGFGGRWLGTRGFLLSLARRLSLRKRGGGGAVGGFRWGRLRGAGTFFFAVAGEPFGGGGFVFGAGGTFAALATLGAEGPVAGAVLGEALTLPAAAFFFRSGGAGPPGALTVRSTFRTTSVERFFAACDPSFVRGTSSLVGADPPRTMPISSESRTALSDTFASRFETFVDATFGEAFGDGDVLFIGGVGLSSLTDARTLTPASPTGEDAASPATTFPSSFFS